MAALIKAEKCAEVEVFFYNLNSALIAVQITIYLIACFTWGMKHECKLTKVKVKDELIRAFPNCL